MNTNCLYLFHQQQQHFQQKILLKAVIEMIVAERNSEQITDNFDDFGMAMTDGLLTDSTEKLYRIKDAISLSKKLGRPLTNEEMKTFEL